MGAEMEQLCENHATFLAEKLMAHGTLVLYQETYIFRMFLKTI